MAGSSFPKSKYSGISRDLLSCWQASTYSYEGTLLKLVVDLEFRRLTGGIQVIDKRGWNIDQETIDRFTPVVNWMYSQTQQDFRNKGISKPRNMFHGVNRKNMVLQPLMSYTERKDIAEHYQKRAGVGVPGIDYDILDLPVPVERIFMWYGGPGWERGNAHYDDLEYIIICSKVKE